MANLRFRDNRRRHSNACLEPAENLPADAGLIVADAFGGAIIRDAPLHRLAGATRRSLLLRFARIGADRLHLLNDPQAAAPSVS